MRSYSYIKSEDLDWQWSSDKKTKIHTLVLRHMPTNKSVRGTLVEGRDMTERKRRLTDTLTDDLTDLVFGKQK